MPEKDERKTSPGLGKDRAESRGFRPSETAGPEGDPSGEEENRRRFSECLERIAPPPVAPSPPAAASSVVEVPGGPARPIPPHPLPWPSRVEVEKGIHQFMALFGPVPHQELIHDVILNSLRLVHDGAPRAELKIFRSAMAELRYAFKVFRAYAGCRKVTIFGSARTPEGAPEYEQARALAAQLAAQGFMVITGAGPGIMEASQAGAGRERSFGVNIRLPFEQAANKHIEGDPKLINFRYFFTRKLIFVREASAIVLFPGGFGTLDEGFETLTLVQTGKSSPVPLILVDRPNGTYWKAWLQFIRTELLGKGLISEEDLAFFTVTEDAGEAAAKILAFYRRYHSIRFVRNHLVIRMLSPLPEGVLEDLNRQFRSLLTSPDGRIVAQGPLPEEQDQPELNALPRLVLDFNRRNYGLLRQLIDRINEVC